MAIVFFSTGIIFKIEHKTKLKKWINKIIQTEKKAAGEINYNFCSDEFLLELNKKYLHHDYFTDILTFDYSEKNSPFVSGDICISIDRVNENARKLKIDFSTELHRVMIHGIFHLCGYKDKSKKEKLEIRLKEEDALIILEKII